MSMSGSTLGYRISCGGWEAEDLSLRTKVLHAHAPRLLSAEWREHVAAVARTAARGPEAALATGKKFGL